MPPLSDHLRAWLRSQIDRLPDADSATDWPRRFEKERDLLVIDGSNLGLWFLGIDGNLYFVDRDRFGLTLELQTDPATVRRVLESAARDLPELRELVPALERDTSPPPRSAGNDSMHPYVTAEDLDDRTTSWLASIDAYNQHAMELRRERSALLVVDMQRFFLDPESPTFTCGGLAILPNVQRLVASFRAAERPVVFTRHVHHREHLDSGIMGWWWRGMCVEDDPVSEIHPALRPSPKEKVVLKHRYSAFYNTDLETVLRCLDVTDLVVCGLMTNLCCESTARDAYYRDYRVFFLADATGSIDEELHLSSLRNLAFGFAWVTRARSVIAELTASR